MGRRSGAARERSGVGGREARLDFEGWKVTQTLLGMRQCSAQGTSQVPFGWNKELNSRGTGRVALREETGEGDSDLVTEGLPCHAERSVPFR